MWEEGGRVRAVLACGERTKPWVGPPPPRSRAEKASTPNKALGKEIPDAGMSCKGEVEELWMAYLPTTSPAKPLLAE